jgi:hypothetical protein
MARAFYDDPPFIWMLPDSGTRLERVRRFFATLTRGETAATLGISTGTGHLGLRVGSGSGGSAISAPAVTGGPVKGEDTAYIVKHVKAEIAGASQSSLVLHTYGYFSAHESPDGSLVHSGPKRGEGYQYIAPDGTRYQRNWTYNKDGSPTGIIGHDVTGPVVNGKQDVALTIINRANHTYSQTHTEYSVTGGAKRAGVADPGPGEQPLFCPSTRRARSGARFVSGRRHNAGHDRSGKGGGDDHRASSPWCA